MTLGHGVLAALLVPGLAVAEPANRIEISAQAGSSFEEKAFGPQLSFNRRIASRGRFDFLVGTTQVYRMTPMLDAPNQLGMGTSRSGFRHHYSALVGPGLALRLPPGDRLVLGVEVLAGATYFNLHGRYTNPAVGIDRTYSTSELGFTFGARVAISFRIGCRWAALASIWEPVLARPSASSHLGLGAAYLF